MQIQWYPGHMTKARRALEEKLKLIDMVIEVVDARAPRATRNPDFDDLFSAKRRMLILNKADLASERATAAWRAHFERGGWAAAVYSAANGSPKKLLGEIQAAAEEIYAKYRAKGVNKVVRCLVAGIPNVGKSAILNRLAGSRKLKEGNTPGVTRSLQWVRLTPYLEMMDSPGLLWPKIEDQEDAAKIALLGSIRDQVLDEDELAFYLIGMLAKAAPEAIPGRYGAEHMSESWETLEAICRARGYLARGGECDTDRGVAALLGDFRSGKLGRVSLELPE